MKKYAHKAVTRTNVLALIAIGLFNIAYFPVYKLLVSFWFNSEEYSHAFITLPVVFYLVWDRRNSFQKNPERFPAVGLSLLAISIFIYPLALFTQMRTIIALSMILTLVGTISYITGFNTLKYLLTPLLLLLLLIPVPDKIWIQLTFPLQLKVSQITELIVGLLSVPIYREGNIMNIPGKSFEVVEACSGLRSIIALLTLSIIMGYFMIEKFSLKTILFFSSVPTAIFVNIVRVSAMILFFYFFKIDLSEGGLHTVTGLIIFGTAFLTMYFILKVLKRWEAISISK